MPDDLRDQFPKVREVVKALRIPVYEMQGYEADDVIGTITRQLESQREPRDDDRHRRSRHAPARHAADAADDDPLRRREHDHLRRRQDRRAVRASARPDGRLQGAQGRPDRQHPGRSRGRREDRGEAHPRVRRASRACSPGSTRSRPEKLRDKLREHREQIEMGRHLSKIVRDLPIEFDLESARLERLRPRHGRPALPRVRVPHADRAPAADAGRDRPAALGQPALRGRERLRAGRQGRRAAGGLGRRPGARQAIGRRAPAPPRLRCRGAGRRPGRPRGRGTDGSRRRRPRASSPRRTCRRRWPPRSSTPAGSRFAVRTGSRSSTPGSPPSRRSGSRSWRTIRGRDAGRRWRSPWPRLDGRVVAADGAEAADALRRLLQRTGNAARRARGQARARRGVRRRSGRRRRCRSPSTPRSPRTSSTPRCAARRSPTSWPRTSTRSCRPPPSCRRPREPGSRRCRRSPCASRWSVASRRSSSTGCSQEVELPLIPVLARMEAVGVALDLDALAVLDREFGAEISRLEQEIYLRRRARVQPRQPQAARADPVLRAQPAQGQADEDRLLDRCVRPGGAAAGPPDDRQAPRVAGLHQAALDVRRGAAHR